MTLAELKAAMDARADYLTNNPDGQDVEWDFDILGVVVDGEPVWILEGEGAPYWAPVLMAALVTAGEVAAFRHYTIPPRVVTASDVQMDAT